jgi:subtilase family serine protease
MQRRFIFVLFYLCAVLVPAAAQPDRIIRAVNSSRSRQVKENLHPLARPQYDHGPIDPSVKMDHVLLVFKPSPAQQSDLDQLLAVVAWLQPEGLTVNESGRGNNWVAFSGAAGQLASALRTSIHRYQFNGQMHTANATEPSLPEALADVVMGFPGLDDFYLKPVATKFVPISADPNYNSAASHFLVPEDFATIYSLTPLYQAGFDGSGQSIAIVGASNIPIGDIRSFRSRYNLPVNDPKLVPYGFDPGFNGAQQGKAQGITTLAASGDSGAAGCDSQGLDVFATRGQAATFPSNLPEVTGVGGTEFNDAGGNYWSATNSPNRGSALSYIPELAWNQRSPAVGLASSGGGVSPLLPKPDWQTGPGVPNDNARDTPDVAMSADLATGAAPGAGTALASLSRSRLPLSATLAGVQAFLEFIGVTPGVVGLTQVNLIAPRSVTAGVRPVVVAVGGVSSPTAYLIMP